MRARRSSSVGSGTRGSARCRESGFTLLEVLAALIILALAFGALLRLVSGGLGGLGAAEDYTSASLLAESWLDGLGVAWPLREGEMAGAFDERFRWRARIRELPADGAGWPVVAYEIELAVVWGDGLRERSMALSTLRVTPAP
jgi:general secretion pathway protein I